MGLLKGSPRMKAILQRLKLIYSRRQPHNLQQLLVRSQFSYNQNITVSKNGRNKFTTCKQIIMGNSFNFKGNVQPLIVKHSIDCNSRSVQYALTCQGCGENYIWETSKKLLERMTLHRQHMRTSEYRFLAVSAHIAQ